MVQINKIYTHHTHTHQTLRERLHWKGLVSIKISNTLPFLKQPPLFYQPLHFCGKNLKNLKNPFLENLKNSTLNPPLYKGGGRRGGGGEGVQLCNNYETLTVQFASSLRLHIVVSLLHKLKKFNDSLSFCVFQIFFQRLPPMCTLKEMKVTFLLRSASKFELFLLRLHKIQNIQSLLTS